MRARALRRRYGRAEAEANEVTFHLRDYLSPGGRYPYEQLPKAMDAALRSGKRVTVLSVPGFMMAMGWPAEEAPPGTRRKKPLRPWSDASGRYYRTAWDVISLRDGTKGIRW